MDSDQHTRQTEGWQESWAVLEIAMDQHGPFDGIMGFSQVCHPVHVHSATYRTATWGMRGLTMYQFAAPQSPDDVGVVSAIVTV